MTDNPPWPASHLYCTSGNCNLDLHACFGSILAPMRSTSLMFPHHDSLETIEGCRISYIYLLSLFDKAAICSCSTVFSGSVWAYFYPYTHQFLGSFEPFIKNSFFLRQSLLCNVGSRGICSRAMSGTEFGMFLLPQLPVCMDNQVVQPLFGQRLYNSIAGVCQLGKEIQVVDGLCQVAFNCRECPVAITDHSKQKIWLYLLLLICPNIRLTDSSGNFLLQQTHEQLWVLQL